MFGWVKIKGLHGMLWPVEIIDENGPQEWTVYSRSDDTQYMVSDWSPFSDDFIKNDNRALKALKRKPGLLKAYKIDVQRAKDGNGSSLDHQICSRRNRKRKRHRLTGQEDGMDTGGQFSPPPHMSPSLMAIPVQEPQQKKAKQQQLPPGGPSHVTRSSLQMRLQQMAGLSSEESSSPKCPQDRQPQSQPPPLMSEPVQPPQINRRQSQPLPLMAQQVQPPKSQMNQPLSVMSQEVPPPKSQEKDQPTQLMQKPPQGIGPQSMGLPQQQMTSPPQLGPPPPQINQPPPPCLGRQPPMNQPPHGMGALPQLAPLGTQPPPQCQMPLKVGPPSGQMGQPPALSPDRSAPTTSTVFTNGSVTTNAGPPGKQPSPPCQMPLKVGHASGQMVQPPASSPDWSAPTTSTVFTDGSATKNAGPPVTQPSPPCQMPPKVGHASGQMVQPPASSPDRSAPTTSIVFTDGSATTNAGPPGTQPSLPCQMPPEIGHASGQLVQPPVSSPDLSAPNTSTVFTDMSATTNAGPPGTQPSLPCQMPPEIGHASGQLVQPPVSSPDLSAPNTSTVFTDGSVTTNAGPPVTQPSPPCQMPPEIGHASGQMVQPAASSPDWSAPTTSIVFTDGSATTNAGPPGTQPSPPCQMPLKVGHASGQMVQPQASSPDWSAPTTSIVFTDGSATTNAGPPGTQPSPPCQMPLKVGQASGQMVQPPASSPDWSVPTTGTVFTDGSATTSSGSTSNQSETEMCTSISVELDEFDDLSDIIDDPDNDPDYEDERSVEDSESCVENSDSDESSASFVLPMLQDTTEWREDELQQSLPRSVYTKKTPVENVDSRKASSENLPCSRPFNEHDFDRCIRYPNIYTKKYKGNGNEKSKSGRYYDNVHACLFCRSLETNIQTHLMNQHAKKEEVSEIKQLQKREKMLETEDCRKKVRKEITRKQALLRNKGDDQHNNSVCVLKQGELLLARRRPVKFDSRLYGGCPECAEWMVLKENYGKHIKVCPAKTTMGLSSAILQSMIFKDQIKTNASKELNEVFRSMHKDDLAYIALEDKLIVAVGETYFMSTYANKLKRKNYSSFRMRLAARLLKLIRNEIGDDDVSMSDCMVVENVDIFAKCALLACGKTNDDELKSPSVALKIGDDLKKMVAAKIAYAAKCRNLQDREEGKLFDELLTREWKLKVKKQAAVLLQHRQFNKNDPLPDPQDIATLAKFLIEKLKTVKLESDITAYRRVVLLTEARLLLYNRRRPGELEALEIETYKKRSTHVNETDLSLRNQLTTLEKRLIESQELLEMRGKSNNKVPLLLPDEVKKPLAYLVDSHVRDNVGIAKEMPYVFASTGKEPMRAGTALDVVKYEAELKHPQRIYATNLRKHTATISQVMGLREHELQWLTKHLGHTQKVHMSHYRQMSGLIERLDIAKLMLLQEQNNVGRFAGVDLADINFEDLDNREKDDSSFSQTAAEVDEPDLNGGVEAYEQGMNDVDDDVFGQAVLPLRKTKKTPVTRVAWTREELGEIQTFFAACLALEKSCPKKKECLAALAKSKSQGGQIYKRHWETVKKKVSHLMTQAKKAGTATEC